MKVVCIYHSVDLDGWMSAAIVKRWWLQIYKEPETSEFDSSIRGIKNMIEFIGYNYGQPIPDLSEYDKIIMCDISFPVKTMELIASKLTWIDHHSSAINDMDKSDYFNSNVKLRYTQTNYAACEITWFHFFPEIVIPEIVRLLGRYDCFGHKGTSEEKLVLEFQYGARQIITNYEEAFESLSLSFTNQNYVLNILNSGATIYKYLCTEAMQSYKNRFQIRLKEQIDSDGAFIFRDFTCINKERFNPINFGIKYHEDGNDGCACFHYANGKWNFSIYNDNGEVDCSVIAKSFGGGGHKGASGFIIMDINDFLDNTKK